MQRNVAKISVEFDYKISDELIQWKKVARISSRI
jgi:hypothetical protein